MQIAAVVKVRAHDSLSGVAHLQVAIQKRHPGALRRVVGRLVVRTHARTIYIRAQDRARNWSKWRTIQIRRNMNAKRA